MTKRTSLLFFFRLPKVLWPVNTLSFYLTDVTLHAIIVCHEMVLCPRGMSGIGWLTSRMRAHISGSCADEHCAHIVGEC